ncbi:MAG: hypothetical protein ACRDKT_01905 [Actinomycetota bacterium]
MTKRFSIATAVLTLFAALLALVLVAATPALAHHKDDHEQGTAAQQDGSGNSERDNDGDADNTEGQTTEDNDAASADENNTQTPNNVEDDGDNAHPSGKDRSVENDGGNQGNSESDPDDDGRGPDRSNGGPDKPGGSGGVDMNDQDGNNGCGNDDDFEDDNEGWCGKPEKEDEVQPTVVTPPPPPTCPEIMGSEEACQPAVQPNIDHTCPDEEMVDSNVKCEKPETEVLGEIITRGQPEVLGTTTSAPATRAAGAVLPFTGGSVTIFLIVALGLLGAGFALMRTRSTK